MNAIRTDQRPPYPAIEVGFDPLQIGAPGSFAFIVGMADVVADRTAFAAN
jgi:hypothetical protein